MELFGLTVSSGSRVFHGVQRIITGVFSVWRSVRRREYQNILSQWFFDIQQQLDLAKMSQITLVLPALQKQGKRIIFLKFELKESAKRNSLMGPDCQPHLHLRFRNPCLICIPPHLRNFRPRSLPPLQLCTQPWGSVEIGSAFGGGIKMCI